ncbi:TIGR03083 family protein [Mycolicibacterium rutilum]|uniref:TIGR03083 family protein n=1 Tax=Mycolicibacterium rutilum TaxID=370526 RepID=A0A1H6LSJ9_MYCRU|nr:maleylpyruvate isomerase family mycothiol-dependent enzyme [Mycolicibacterium rutilum]SEH89391.1 TIGR03083 family protein [Mycolicibacterium rutilum]
MILLDKSAVLDGLFAQWDAIDDVVGDLAEAEWQAPTSLPGWSVRDVVAHVVGTESMLQGAPTPQADIDVSTLAHVRNDIGVLNELWVRELSVLPAGELLQRYRDVTAERRDALAAISDDDWNTETFTPAGPDSYGRFMRVRVFDCWMHEHDIRDALERPATDPTGSSPELALDELTASMGFVVGKLGRAPEGSRVSIVLTGPLGRTINVAVDGRARVVDDFGGDEPTTTITLDALLFARLAGGRQALDHGVVGYGGDQAVGRRIVEHLNFVI